jgi:hypothetical protein
MIGKCRLYNEVNPVPVCSGDFDLPGHVHPNGAPALSRHAEAQDRAHHTGSQSTTGSIIQVANQQPASSYR